VVPLSAGSADKAVALAGVMAIAAGLTCLLAGFARLGFITDLLSKPIRYGYMNGIAVVVIVSQLPLLFGFRVNGGGTPAKALEFFQALANGQTHFWSLLIGALSLALILLLRHQRHISGILLAVVVATLYVGWQTLDKQGVAVLGSLPQGFPAFSFPLIPISDLLQVAVGGAVAALLAVSETSVLSRAYATKTGDRVSPNKEMVGLGMANLATGFFQGFPVSSSASRTPVAYLAGARTQLANVVGACLVLVLLIYAPDLLRYLPDTVLAAVVIASMIGLTEVRSVWRIYKMRPAEFWLSLGCSAGIVVLGPIQGIGLAVLAALVSFLWESWRPYSAVLAREDNLKGYHDITRYPHARRIPGLVLFRWDAPLFFANAELFQERALAAVAASPTPVRWLVVAAEPVTGIDVTAADILLEMNDRLEAEGVDLVFAEMKDPVKDQMKQFGLFKKVGEAHFFPTIGQAVSSYLETYNIPWVDWEEAR
jgi:high affinity sulfate transporter 1